MCFMHVMFFAIQGFNGIHKLEGRWNLSPGQDPNNYQLHCYEFESEFPKSEYRCELFGSSSRRFSLIYYDVSTDSYIVNGETAGKPNVIFDTESGNKILEWDPMGNPSKSSKWTKSGNIFRKIVLLINHFNYNLIVISTSNWL